MAEYDLNDPTDQDIMKGQFNMYTAEEWEEYIELASSLNYSYKNVNILKTAQKKAGIAKYLSIKVIHWVLSLVDQLDAHDEEE